MVVAVIIAAHVISMVALMFLGVIIQVKLKSTKREFFVLFLACVVMYVMGTYFEIVASTLDGARLGIWTRSLGGILMMPAFLMFAQRFGERFLPKTVNGLVWVSAFLLIVIVWTSEWHDLFYQSLFLYPEGAAPTIRIWGFYRGILFPLVLIIYPTLCLAIASVLLLWRARNFDLTRKRALRILVVCLVLPVLFHIFDVTGLNTGAMYSTILAIPLVCGLGYLAIFRYDMLENEETIRSQNWLKEMIANISHDVKTPLTILNLSLEKLLYNSPEDPNYRRDIQIAYEKSLDLQRLLQNLIEVTRIESAGSLSRLLYKCEWISQNTILSNIQKKYGDYLESAGLYLDVTGIGEDVLLYADSEKIWSVFDNIIYNAVRHTRSGGISVIAECAGEFQVIAVKDTGCGIAPKYLPHIFERFYKVAADRSAKGGDSGLGLFIVKSIMESFQGRVEIQSEVGVGSSVLLFFKAQKSETLQC